MRLWGRDPKGDRPVRERSGRWGAPRAEGVAHAKSPGGGAEDARGAEARLTGPGVEGKTSGGPWWEKPIFLLSAVGSHWKYLSQRMGSVNVNVSKKYLAAV